MIMLSMSLGPWQAVHAYDWSNDYGADLTVGRENNFFLTDSDKVDTNSGRIGLFANFQGESEISTIGITLSGNATNYSASEVDDTDGYSLALYTTRRGERLSGLLDLSYDQESTTETELLDTGDVVNGYRKTFSVSPGVDYAVDERNSVFANLMASDVSYDTDTFTDYKQYGMTLGWRYLLDETSDASVSLSTTRYDPDDDDPTDIISLELGYGFSTSEATDYTLSIGYSNVDEPGSSESGDANYSVAVNHRTDERNTFVAAFGQSYEASGDGEVRDVKQLNLQWQHALSERWQFNLAAAGVSDSERDYYSLDAGANYQYSQEVNLGTNLQYRQQEDDSDDNQDAHASSIFVTLSYSPI